jgi:hypothetical protein
MSVFTNKHVVVALLVAPVLAIGAWYAVGLIGAETPQRAVPGQSYPLVAKSNCRYASGQCSLENGDIEFHITPVTSNDTLSLKITSNQSSGRVMLGLGQDINPPKPEEAPYDASNQSWHYTVNENQAEKLFFVAEIRGSRYFAKLDTVFFERLSSIPQGRD